MSDVFVSYSRKADAPFVDRLAAGLAARGKDVWFDREDIIPSSPWRPEIDQAIVEADAFLFVITPESVLSQFCRAELDRALSMGKRIIPLLARETSLDSVPPELAELHFLSFVDSTDFEGELGRLLEVLDTDLEQVHLQTQLLTRANHWVERNADRSLLLRGRELDEAERWLDKQLATGRTVVVSQQRFIRASRRAAIRRQRGSVSAALAVAAVMAVLVVLTGLEWHSAVSQRRQAETERAAAVAERNVADSQYIAQEAQGQLQVDPQIALILALDAARSSDTAQARDAVRSAVAQSALAAKFPDFGGESQWPFDPRGGWVVSYYMNDTDTSVVTVWNASRPTVGGSTDHPYVLRLAKTSIASAQFDAAGNAVLLVATAVPTEDNRARVLSWSWRGGGLTPLASGSLSDTTLDRQGTIVAGMAGKTELVLRRTVGAGSASATLAPGVRFVSELAFSADGSLLAAVGSDSTEVWRITNSGGSPMELKELGTFALEGGGAVAFSGDDTRLAVAGEGPEIYVVELADPDAAPLVHQIVLPAALGVHCCDVDSADSLAWSPDGSALAAGTEDQVVRIWVGSSSTPLYFPYTTEGGGPDVAFSPDGRYLLNGNLLWDWQSPIDRYLSDPAATIAVSPRSDLVAVALPSGGVVGWNSVALTTRWLVVPRRGLAPLGSIVFSPDGAYLAGSTQGLVLVWNASTSRSVASIDLPAGGSKGRVSPLQFSSNGRSLAIQIQVSTGPASHQAVIYWNWESSQRPAEISFVGDYAYLCGFSGSTVDLLTSPVDVNGPSRLLAWDGQSSTKPTLIASIPQRDGWDQAALLSDDRLMIADQVGAEILDLRNGRRLENLAGYQSFSLSPDRNLVALSGLSGKVYLWDLESEDSPLYAFTASQSDPEMAWERSDLALAVADVGGGVNILHTDSFLPWPQLLRIAHSLVVTTLTPAQRHQFLPA